jgi:hypothetical protein
MNNKSSRILAASCILLSIAASSGCSGVAGANLAEPVYVMHEVEVRLDRVEASGASKVGDVDRIRIVYDRNAIDPKSHRVRLLNFQHLIHGAYTPQHPDPVFMPMNDAWLDLSKEPYRLHFHAAVTHGMPILIDVDARTRRLTIHPQSDPHEILLSGRYQIDPRPITGAAAQAAATAASPSGQQP